MENVYLLRLSGLDLGQIIDGLCVREKSWRDTAIYLRDGFIADDSFLCEECNDEHEADKLADHYKRLIAELQTQRREQDATGSNPERQLYLDGKSDGQLNIITRIEANWAKIQRCASSQIRSELMSLTDDICDDSIIHHVGGNQTED